MDYFEARGISPDFYKTSKLPEYLKPFLGRETKILDFGCGFGQLLTSMKENACENLYGVDINSVAVAHCQGVGLRCKLISSYEETRDEEYRDFDLVVMSHVLEHLPKDSVIPLLRYVRETLLSENGQLVVMVPNGQSNTNCYWTYEDFTHNLLFTAGSIYYTLKMAGFREVRFLDADCTAGLSIWRKLKKRFLLRVYEANYDFWNRVTSSSFHKPSPRIYSFEIKVLANR